MLLLLFLVLIIRCSHLSVGVCLVDTSLLSCCSRVPHSSSLSFADSALSDLVSVRFVVYSFISHGGLMRTCRLPLLYSVSRLAVLFFTGLHRRVPPVGNIIVYVCRLKFSDIDRCSCNSLHILCCIHSRLQVGRFFSYPFVEVCPCNNSLSRRCHVARLRRLPSSPRSSVLDGCLQKAQVQRS